MNVDKEKYVSRELYEHMEKCYDALANDYRQYVIYVKKALQNKESWRNLHPSDQWLGQQSWQFVTSGKWQNKL